jgi:uncharacterized protein DUF7008
MWERTWDLQREEDATGKKLDIPVPPKYKNTDFQKPSYWRNRGKLDVPKERFISYLNASTDKNDLLLGWAGWDHREQAYALITLAVRVRSNRLLSSLDFVPGSLFRTLHGRMFRVPGSAVIHRHKPGISVLRGRKTCAKISVSVAAMRR